MVEIDYEPSLLDVLKNVKGDNEKKFIINYEYYVNIKPKIDSLFFI